MVTLSLVSWNYYLKIPFTTDNVYPSTNEMPKYPIVLGMKNDCVENIPGLHKLS